MRTRQEGSQKPIARANGKVSAKIYSGRFRMAEHMRYLDINALNRVKKAEIDIGSVSAAGVSVPLVAEIRKGMIVRLRPLHCKSCKPSGRKSPSRLERQRAAKAALQKVRDSGLRPVRLPMSTERLRGGGLGNTITIIIDWEICIVIESDDGTICYYCTQTGSFCIGPPSP
jgi:hypothetical protein